VSEHPTTVAAQQAAQQAALRRVAVLVAEGAPAAEVFAAIAREVAELLHPRMVEVFRWERDSTVTVMGTWSDGPNPFPAGSVWPWEDPTLDLVMEQLRSGRPVRIDVVEEELAGHLADAGMSVGVGSAVGAPVMVDGEAWGHVSVQMAGGKPLPEQIEARLADFTELVATAISNSAARERVARLADEQAALRRVATLVARGAPPAEVFAAVAEQLGRLLDAASSGLVRFEDAGIARVVAGWGRLDEAVPTGSRLPLGGTNVVTAIARTGRPARLDEHRAQSDGAIGDHAQRLGTSSAVGAPVVVAGRLWGAVVAAALDGVTLPADAEPRLEQFAELIATAISNTEARLELARLADEQVALRRVATLVAQEAPTEVLLAKVAEEVASVFGDGFDTAILRYEPDDATATVVAVWGGRPEGGIQVGLRLGLDGDGVTARVHREQRPVRVDDYPSATGAIAEPAHVHGLRSGVGCPILVQGRPWGVIAVGHHDGGPFDADAHRRITQFAELVATAIINADSREQLKASRARVITAGDEARRRVVRDLHDGAQQRLVHVILTLTLARQAFRDGDVTRAESLSAEALEHAELGTTELRELAHGILPEALTRSGLAVGIEALVSRLDVPVGLEVTAERVVPDVEASAYFVVAEALTNVAKHARATRADVTATIHDNVLTVTVRDDGVGGADPDGHGLVGLADRVAALGGRLRVESPPGVGTLLVAELPLDA
jgi:signal transduction histidine kinase